jgi:hypothetical protein
LATIISTDIKPSVVATATPTTSTASSSCMTLLHYFSADLSSQLFVDEILFTTSNKSNNNGNDSGIIDNIVY